ncbi:MAG: M48 family metallopeptidase [Beijerinckiaceae bacterium]|nr:M48 family metallopeptidase [Beijerinckiaceae bacterium]
MIPIAFIVAIVLSGALGISLLYRQAAAVAAHREHVPDGFDGWISAEEHRRAAAYTLARTRLAIAETVFDTVLAVLWLIVFLGPLYALLGQFVAPGISRAVAVVVAFALLERVLHLPFSIYSTFALEARFGFNRATPAMFLRDRIKGVALSLLLGVPLLYGLFWLLRVLPGTWWLLGWAAVMVLTIAMSVIYPAVIAPLFNKFTPLPDGAFKARVEALLAKCGFASKGLYVMDASRRSAHGNAYFTGFGKAKRIVLFDTLLQHHTPDEILSILAHELGHYKLGHVGQRIAETAVLTFLGFVVLRWAFAAGGLAGAFGLPADPGVILIVVLTATGPVLHLLSPLTSWLSRRAEYQADNFARAMAGSGPMISALTKLARDNLSTLTPDALYASFYDSHPPVPARIARLRAEPAVLDRIRV